MSVSGRRDRRTPFRVIGWMNEVRHYCLIDHGIDHLDLLPLFSTVDTPYNAHCVGLGDNPWSAFQDALGKIERNGWSTTRIRDQVGYAIPTEPSICFWRLDPSADDRHRYVYVIQYEVPWNDGAEKEEDDAG